MPAALETQRTQIQTDILAQARTARVQVHTLVKEALKREPRAVEVGPAIGVSRRERGVKGVEKWKQEELSKIKKEETRALGELKTAYEKALAAPAEYVTEGLTPSEITLLKEYGPEEITRRRKLAAEEAYAVEVRASEAKMKETHVLVAGKDWVKKTDYNPLSTTDKALLQKLGVEGYNKEKERLQGVARGEWAERQRQEQVKLETFKKENIEIKTDFWVSRKWWTSLTASERASAEFKNGEVSIPAPPLTIAEAKAQFAAMKNKGEISIDAVFTGIKDGYIQYTTPAPGPPLGYGAPAPPLTMADAKKLLALEIRKDPSLVGSTVTRLLPDGGYEYSPPAEKVSIIGYSPTTKEVIIKFESGAAEWRPESEFPEFAKLTKAQKIEVALSKTDEYTMPGKELEILPPGFIGPAATWQIHYRDLTAEQKIGVKTTILPPEFIGPPAVWEIRFEDLTKIQQTEYMKAAIYTIETVSGKKVDIPVAEWKGMTEFEQLTVQLEREPSEADMLGIARPDMPSALGLGQPKWMETTDVFPGPKWIDYVARFGVGVIEHMALGAQLAVPGIQFEAEKYWQETREETARLHRQYHKEQMKDWPFPVSEAEIGALTVFESFFPATRMMFPGVSPKDIQLKEWVTTAAIGALFVTPLAIKATRAVLGQIRLATVKMPGPVVTGFRLVEFQLAKTLPVVKIVVESPKVRIGTGLERAGFSKVVSDAAFAAGRALKELRIAERAIKGVKTAAPKYQQLAYTLKQAQFKVQKVDSAFLHTLKDLTLSPQKIKMLERATGFKGLKEPIVAYGKSIKAVEAAYKEVKIAETALRRAEASRIPWKRIELLTLRRQLRATKTIYEKAKVTSRRASGQLRDVLKPRYGELLPEPRPYVAETPFARRGLYIPEGPKPVTPLMGEPGATSWSPLSPGARARVQAIADKAEAAYFERMGIKPLMPKAELGVAVAEPLAALERGGLWMPEVSPMGLPINPLIWGPRVARPGIPSVALPGFEFTTKMGLYMPTAFAPLAMAMPEPGVVEVPEVELAPGFAEPLVAPARELSATERHALGTMTAAQRARLLEGEEQVWAVGQPIPGAVPGTGIQGLTLLGIGIAPVTGLAPVAGLAPITRLVLGMRLAPVTGLAPATRIVPGIKLAPVTGLAPTTKLAPMTRLAPVTRLAPATKLAPITGLVHVTGLVPATGIVPITRIPVTLKVPTRGWFRPPPPFFWLPEGDGDEKKKKKMEEEVGFEVEPYPGGFGELILYMTEELQPVVRPLHPRPVVKKRKYVLRKKGVYPVAGFRRVRR